MECNGCWLFILVRNIVSCLAQHFARFPSSGAQKIAKKFSLRYKKRARIVVAKSLASLRQLYELDS